jgi:hypothetical protein
MRALIWFSLLLDPNPLPFYQQQAHLAEPGRALAEAIHDARHALFDCCM